MSRFFPASLRSRLLLLVLFAVIPAFLLTIFTNWNERRLAATEVREEALRLARLAAADQEQLVESVHQLLLTLARLPEVHDGAAAHCQALLADLLRQHRRYTNLGVIKANGDVVCSGSPVAKANVPETDTFASPCDSQLPPVRKCPSGPKGNSYRKSPFRLWRTSKEEFDSSARMFCQFCATTAVVPPLPPIALALSIA